MSEITHRIRFVASAADAREEIQKYENQIVAVSRTADAMANTLGGGRLLQAANNWVAAVEKVGGVTKLTTAEKERLNGVLEQALQKYQALGQMAPMEMTQLWEQTKRVKEQTESAGSATSSWGQLLGALAPQLLSVFSVTTVIGFARGLAEASDNAIKMAAQTGMSTREVQQLSFVSQQTSVSLEGMVGGIQTLQQRLGAGDSGAIGALKELGINVSSFVQQRPAEQFSVLASAIGGINDPTERARLASELFGKSWKEVIAALTTEFPELTQQAFVMSDSAVTSIDRLSDRFAAYWTVVKNIFGLMIMSVPLWAQTIADAFKSSEDGLSGVERNAMKAAGAMVDLSSGVTFAEQTAGRAAKALDSDMEQVAQSFDEAAKYAEQMAERQAAAIERSNKRQLEALDQTLRSNRASALETERLWNEYDALRVAHGGTTTEALVAQVNRWAADYAARMRAMGADTQQFYDALEAVSREKVASVETDWNTLRRVSRDTLMEQYEVARNTYLEMAGSAGEYSRATIEHMRAVMDAAREAAYGMGDAFEAGSARAQSSVSSASKAMGSDLDSVAEKARKTAEELHNMGSSVTYDLTTNYGRKLIEEMNPGITEFLQQGYSIAQAMRLLQGRRYNFQVDVGSPDGNDWYPKRAAGGPVDAGMPYWVGELGPELFVPRSSGAIVPNGAAAAGISLAPGAVVINYPILNSPQAMNQLAAIIGEAIVKRARGGGLRVPVGV